MAHAAPRGSRAPGWGAVAGAVGELLVTGGLVVLLFVVYELFVTDLLTAQRQRPAQSRSCARSGSPHRQPRSAARSPASSWATPSPCCYIPRLGEDYHARRPRGHAARSSSRRGRATTWTRRCRASRATCASPGTGSARARRSSSSTAAARRPDRRRDGGQLVRLPRAGRRRDRRPRRRPQRHPRAGRSSARPTSGCISPTPDAAASAAPSGAYLTLTTCHPRYSARQRLVIHAGLDGGAIAKSA